jgi:hypothetical protein
VWRFMPPGPARWAVCTLMVFGPYLFLARALFAHQHLGPRTYRYAE